MKKVPILGHIEFCDQEIFFSFLRGQDSMFQRNRPKKEPPPTHIHVRQ